MPEEAPPSNAPQGMYSGKLDQQVRLKVPADWASFFNGLPDKRLFCTCLDGRIGLIFPMEVWLKNLKLLDSSPDTQAAKAVTFTANKNGGTVEMDPQNRVVLPQKMREVLKLADGQTLYLYSYRGHVEVLTEAAYQAEDIQSAPVVESSAQKMWAQGMQ